MIPLSQIFSARPGWYRGDFHAHSAFSDGAFFPRQLNGLAVSHGLDFLAITDHNDLRACDDFKDIQEVLTLPGIEITLEQGHWNVYGFPGNTAEVRQVFGELLPLSYGEAMRFYRSPAAFQVLMARIAEAGYLRSLNHPCLRPWEWRVGYTRVDYFQAVELVNDPTYRGRHPTPGEEGGLYSNEAANPMTRRLWSAWLNAGYRLTALGGSDFHALPPSDDGSRTARLNLPLTYVYAEELSARALLEGIRRRHAYITLGPRVDFQAEAEGETFRLGSDLGAVEKIRFTGRVSGVDGQAQARLICNGQAVLQTPVLEGRVEVDWTAQLEVKKPFWCRLEVVSPSDQTVAVTNPFFAGPPPESLAQQPATFADFASTPLPRY